MKRLRHFILAKKKWVLLAVLVIIGGGFFLNNRSKQKKEPTIVPVKSEAIASTVEVSGKVDARRKATLKFLGGGKLVSTPHEEGKYLLKGSPIASIDARDLQKSLQASLNDYLTDRATFDQGIADRKDVALTDAIKRTADKLQYSLNNSVIDVELRALAIQNATLYAPFDGVITVSPVKSAGVQVIATDGFEMVDPQSLMFEGEVDEVDIGKVRSDMPVEIHIDAYPDETIKGVISTVGLKARVSTSTGATVFPVTVTIPDANVTKYRIGLNGTMNIIVAQKEKALVIPLDATSKKDEKVFVQVATEEKGKQVLTDREIKTGIESDDMIEVTSGLNEGERIVVPE